MIPPFIGFFAKLYILLDTLDNTYFYLSFIAILSSMIGAVNYLRVIVAIHFEETVKNIIKVQESISSVIALITMLIILFFIYPSPVFNFIFFTFN